MFYGAYERYSKNRNATRIGFIAAVCGLFIGIASGLNPLLVAFVAMSLSATTAVVLGMDSKTSDLAGEFARTSSNTELKQKDEIVAQVREDEQQATKSHAYLCSNPQTVRTR